MRRFLLLCMCVNLDLITPCVSDVQNVTIGYLTVDQTERFVRDRQGRIISGAISYAIEEINKNKDLLGDYHLNLVWSDTKGSTLVGTRHLTEQWRNGAVAFIGLEDSCSVEASVAAAWDLPLISYKCADYAVSDKIKYPTFARTFPPATQVTKSIIAVLLEFEWKRFTLIVGSSHKQKTIAEKLLELAANHNISINGRQEYMQPHIPLTTGNPFPGIVERTFVDTRVYVFLGGINGMVDFLANLYDRGLLDTGEYVVIYVDHGTFDEASPTEYFKRTIDRPGVIRNIEASRSLLIITSSPPSNPNYTEFQKTVNRYNEKPPFNFPNPFPHLQKKVTQYAAYLYDAMVLYARAAHEVISTGGNITNGKAIINRIRSRNYTSIRGVLSYIDENGDAEGNYTLLSRVPFKTVETNYSMQPVGYFLLGKGFHSLKFFSGVKLDWVGGKPPVDEPVCGYRGERCIPVKQYTGEIVGGVVGGLFTIAMIVALIVYRNRKYEQEIAGLLWKVPIDQIRWNQHKNSLSYDRRPSLRSNSSMGSQGSIDSRMSFTQIYTTIATYNGQIVAITVCEKKNLDISRKMKKEMKLMRNMRHKNVNPFIGACISPPSFIILTEYCAKGSLQDILENEDLKLDDVFIASLVGDIIKGMRYLHESELNHHGNLKSSNCVVNSRWTLQVADFGLLDFRAGRYKMEDEHAFYKSLFWRAPEQLRYPSMRGSQKGDIYSFGIILHEVIGRVGPYGYCNMEPKTIIENVKMTDRIEVFRPDTRSLPCKPYVVNVMRACWAENPVDRPDLRTVSKDLSQMWNGKKLAICDNMMEMMESYQLHLEELVEARTEQLVEEKKKSEALLYQMLPRSIAEQLKRCGVVEPEAFNSVTIYFSDICEFTMLSAESTPMEVVDLLNDLYTCFDSIVKEYDVYKVETIGDAYMVVSGAPVRNGDNHAGEIASMALKILGEIRRFRIKHRPEDTLRLRIGIHSGPCVAGVVGLTMQRYTLFGDTVNTASRMETYGEALKIHCSTECKKLLDKLGGYTLSERGYVSMKGKGELFTYWLENEDETVREERKRRRVCLKRGKETEKVQNVHENDEYHSTPSAQPLLNLLRESSAENHSLRSNSPKHFSSSLDQGDSPRTYRTESPLNFQCKNYRSPVSGIVRHLPNGFFNEEMRLLNGERTGSGMELADDDGEFDITNRRHNSLGDKQSLQATVPNAELAKKLLGTTLTTSGNNNNGAQICFLRDTLPLEDRCCSTESMA